MRHPVGRQAVKTGHAAGDIGVMVLHIKARCLAYCGATSALCAFGCVDEGPRQRKAAHIARQSSCRTGRVISIRPCFQTGWTMMSRSGLAVTGAVAPFCRRGTVKTETLPGLLQRCNAPASLAKGEHSYSETAPGFSPGNRKKAPAVSASGKTASVF